MNTSHTPGPWKASGRYIAAGGYHLAVTTNAPPEMDQEWKANARLIAAAPQLLEQCILLCDAIESFSAGDRWPELDKARAAINLATGQIP